MSGVVTCPCTALAQRRGRVPAMLAREVSDAQLERRAAAAVVASRRAGRRP